MTAKTTTVAFAGAEARLVDVQVQITGSAGESYLPAFSIVGLADKAVAESKERVRGAFAALGLSLPQQRLIVNLAPADRPKEGSHFDLLIAIGLLAAMGVLPPEAAEEHLALGELGLDGSIAPSAGVLPAAIAAQAAGLGLICPAAGGPEAAWAGGDLAILAPATLIQLVNHFKGTQILSRPAPGEMLDASDGPDLRDVKGQESAKRALEIAAAGGHNLLIVNRLGPKKYWPDPMRWSNGSVRLGRLAGLAPPHFHSKAA